MIAPNRFSMTRSEVHFIPTRLFHFGPALPIFGFSLRACTNSGHNNKVSFDSLQGYLR